MPSLRFVLTVVLMVGLTGFLVLWQDSYGQSGGLWPASPGSSAVTGERPCRSSCDERACATEQENEQVMPATTRTR